MVIKLFLLSDNLFALETLSYSGRLVQTNGSPVAGPVTLRAELAYTNALATVLCTEDIPSVTLTKGVFHIKLNLDCSASGLTLTQVLSQVPNGESVAIRITDITNIITPISYNFQALHAIPFANVASQLVQMGATNDQVLKWNNTTKKWEPGSPGGGGTVTTVSGTLPISVANGTSTPVVSISQANSTTNGYLSSTDWNTFNNKQNALPGGGNTTHYLRGDSSWQTLNTDAVTEGTKLYFENARVLLAPLTGFLPASSAIVDTDTVLSAFNKTQGQINTINSNATHFLLKDSADTLSSNVTLSGSISSTLTGDIIVRDTPLGLTSAVNKGYVDSGDALKVNKSGDTISGVLTLDDDLKIKATGAGTNYVTLRANSAAANYNLVLPTSAGSTGQFLQTDGSGNLSWVAQSSSATPSGAAGGDLAGTYPNPTLKAGVVTDTHIATTLSQSKITNLTTDLASKQSTTLSNGNILVGNGSNVATAVAVSGDATLNNTGVLTLANSGVTAGTYNSVTVDGKGRVTGGTLGTTISSLGVTTPITNTGTASDPVLAIDQANTTTNGYLSSTDWNTFNNKQATISKATTQDVSKLRIYGANATNYVELSAATLTGNRSLIFPDSNGSSGNVLSTDGAGNLSWTSLSTAAPVTSVNTFTGAVTLTTTNIAEGTNQYHTGARVLATPITAPTLTNASIATSDTVQVAFGKLQAQFNNILSLALSGLSTATNAAITASDTIISAFGKLQKQITDLSGDVTTLSASNSNKLNKNTADSITATITVSGAGDVIVPSTPAGMTSAVNKTYVDDRIANANNQWGTDGTNVYRTSGNVGIGTTTPTATLHVNKTAPAGTISSTGTAVSGAGTNFTTAFSVGDQIVASGQVKTITAITDATNLTVNSGFTADLAASTAYARVGTILNSGNVGIGTSTPTSPLHVKNNTGTNDGITIENAGAISPSLYWYRSDTTAGSKLWRARTNSNTSWLLEITDDSKGTPVEAIHAIRSGATISSVNFPNGKVGIGTTSPGAQLHIGSSEASAGTTGTKTRLVLQPYGHTGGPWKFDARDVGANAYLDIKYGSGNSMTFDNSGNVGIGTSSPSHKLDVNGSVQFGTNTATSSNIVFSPSAAAQGYIRMTSDASANYIQSGLDSTIGSTRDLRFSPSFTTAPWMTIQGSTGNVGIGATAPLTSLHIVSTQPSTEVHPNRAGILLEAEGTSVGGRIAAKVSSDTESPLFVGYRSRGTKAAPTGLLSGDQITAVSPVGYDGAGSWQTGAHIRFNTTENWSSSAIGSAISFRTPSNGTTSVPERMRIDHNGNVGIGTTSPSYKLDVQGGDINASGSVRAAGVALTSDIRYKENIAPLENVLEKILKIRGVSYNWKAEEFPEKHFNERRQVGVIAQEVERQFPEVVDTNKDGFKSVNYPALVAPLIEAVRALYNDLFGVKAIQLAQTRQIASKADKEEIKALKEENIRIKSENAEIKLRLEKIEKMLKAR